MKTALSLSTHDLYKNAEKTGVIAFLSQIFCQKAVEASWNMKDNFFNICKMKHGTVALLGLLILNFPYSFLVSLLFPFFS